MPSQPSKPELSIVVPVKNEADVIDAFIARIVDHCRDLAVVFEIVFVNDGSTDQTLPLLLTAQTSNPELVIVNLSRNFGKEVALSAGLDHCTGRAVIPMDADFQDPPEVVPELFAKFKQGFDVVLAKRANRKADSLSKRFFARAFHWLFKNIAETEIARDAGDFRLMSERVVDVVRAMPERARFMKGMLAWPGFKTSEVFYDRPERVGGESNWRFSQLLKLALDGLVSFSTLPLRIWTYLGAILALSSIVYMVFTVIKTLTLGVDEPGYASLLAFILLIGGVNLIGIGILGEYIGRIFIEVKGRPLYVVDAVIRSDEGQSSELSNTD